MGWKDGAHQESHWVKRGSFDPGVFHWFVVFLHFAWYEHPEIRY
jgi:hypothetical protein